jgi:hypothetical protein
MGRHRLLARAPAETQRVSGRDTHGRPIPRTPTSSLKGKHATGFHRTAATIVVLASSGGGLEHSMAADDDGELSWAVRTAVAVAVFSLGLLVGAAIAAWVVPPI